MAEAPLELDAKVENLRQILADLKAFDKNLARATRRRLRQAGDDARDEMRDILAEPSPGVVTGKTYKIGRDKLGRSRRLVDKVKTRDAGRSRSSGTRKEISKGIRLKVMTGARSQGIRLTSDKGRPMHKAYNLRSWRHPVFGDRGAYVEQAGRPYFGEVLHGPHRYVERMRHQIEVALEEAVEALASSRGVRP